MRKLHSLLSSYPLSPSLTQATIAISPSPSTYLPPPPPPPSFFNIAIYSQRFNKGLVVLRLYCTGFNTDCTRQRQSDQFRDKSGFGCCITCFDRIMEFTEKIVFLR